MSTSLSTNRSTIHPGRPLAQDHLSVWADETTKVQNVGKRVFRGLVEVHQVANGYIASIASGDGRLADTHIAHTITEVNEIIAAAMVAFQLENS